jgi:hypothetical protein
MRIETIHLYRNGYSEGDPLKGHIQFSGANGKVDLTLKQEHIAGVLKAVADAVITAAREVSANLTAEVIEHEQKLLEAPSEGSSSE